MRILVLSDSHRRGDLVDRIIAAQPTAEQVFFLGDNVSDIEDLQFAYPNKSFHIVSGNCDFSSLYKSTDTAYAGEMKVLYTHGHTLNVKYTLDNLIEKAKSEGCSIALYGHTHCSNIVYEDGITVVNPGSLSSPRDTGPPSYAVIDIEKGGIMPIIISI